MVPRREINTLHKCKFLPGEPSSPFATVICLSSVSKEETEESEELGWLAEFLPARRAEDLEPVFLVLDPAMAHEG